MGVLGETESITDNLYLVGIPESICEGETISEISFDGYIAYDEALILDPCHNGCIDVHYKIEIFEDDITGDDPVYDEEFVGEVCDCEGMNVVEKFSKKNFDLAPYIKEDPGSSGEFYARATGTKIKTAKGRNVELYLYENGETDECKCLSGTCCDTRERPYKYKSVGSQPTGLEDDYDCRGTNSAVDTSTIFEIDYYCSGTSRKESVRENKERDCGTCSYCEDGVRACIRYDVGETCGTASCDGYDTSCRDYHDADKYCNSKGECVAFQCDGGFTKYTDAAKGTSCGTNKECDGSGICEECVSQQYSVCYEDDVYWYDACDRLGGKRYECGSDYCGNWDEICKGKELWKTRTCYSKGCDDGHCFNNDHTQEEFVETCLNSCSDGRCSGCSRDEDCGDESRQNPYCGADGNVYMTYTIPDCKKPGQPDSYCDYSMKENRIVKFCLCGCSGGDCVTSCATCSDSIKNGDETDIDCGGSCSKCANTKTCSINADCQSDYCNPSTKKCENKPDTCTNECSTSGAKRCSEDDLQTCGNYDPDTCLEWGGDVACPNGCSNDACIVDANKPNLLFSSLIIQHPEATLTQINVLSYEGFASYWRFDEGIGFSARDSIGSNDLDGKLLFTKWAEGRVNAALYCDKETYMQRGLNFNMDFSSKKEGSVSVWLKFSSTDSVGKYILTIQDQTSRLLEIVQSGNGNMQAIVYQDATNWIGLNYPLSRFNIDEWYLVTLTWDEANVKLWVNDNVVDTKIMSINYKPKADRISVCRDYNAERYFFGMVDELAIFDKALSEQGIKKNYDNGLAGREYERRVISKSVYRVEPGDITFAFKLKNDGKKDATNVFWSLDTGIGTTKKNSRGIIIKSGTESLVFTKQRYNTAGLYSIKVTADPENKISETNEGDNEKTLEIEIKSRSQKLSTISGDVNCDSQLDIADATSLMNYLFSSEEITCKDNADFNSDGKLDMGDPIAILNYLF